MSSGAYDSGQRNFTEPAIVAGKSLGEPRSLMLVPSYPHKRPSLEPKPLLREKIWTVAKEARRQLFPRPRPKMDIPQIVGRKPLLEVEGLAFKISWKLDQPDSSRLSVSK